MITSFDCRDVQDRLLDYVEALLPGEERAAVERHIGECSACGESVKRSHAVNELLQHSIGIESIGGDAAARIVERLRKPARPRASWPAELSARPTSATVQKPIPPVRPGLPRVPAWCLSVVLHLLVIGAAGVTWIATRYPAPPLLTVVTELRFTPPSIAVAQAPARMDTRVLNAMPGRRDERSALKGLAFQRGGDLEAAIAVAEGRPELEFCDVDCRWADGLAKAAPFTPGVPALFRAGGGKFGDAALLGIEGEFANKHFAQRCSASRKQLVQSNGGSIRSEQSVAAALRWLAKHQEADGRWSTKNTGGRGMHSSVGSLENWDPGVTGLALLAFLGAGNTEISGEYHETVRRAVAWIVSQQREDGAIGTDPHWKHCFGEGYAYHHVICATALAEAAGMARVPATIRAAQRAVNFSIQYQSGEGQNKGGWRYYRKSTDADASMTSWFLTQLYTAQLAGLNVDRYSIEGGLRALKCFQIEAAQGRYGYADKVKADPDSTAMAGLCQLRAGANAREFHESSAWLLDSEKPEWRANLGHGWGGGWPMYYCYNATLFEFQVHGEEWPSWNEALQRMLIGHQRSDDAGSGSSGSWDPQSDWEAMVGRAYTTALGALTLEIYYRFKIDRAPMERP